MREISWMAIGYGLFILQTAAAEELAIASILPNFLALGLVASACRPSRVPGVVWGAALGLLADCLLPSGLGIGIICYTVTSWAIQQFQGERGAARPFPPGVTFAATAAVGLGTLGLGALAEGSVGKWSTWLLPILGGALYTALLAAVLGIAARLFTSESTRPHRPAPGRRGDRWSMLTGKN